MREFTIPTHAKHAKRVARAESIIGYEFNNKSILEAALTHPSAAQMGKNTFNYERLEFLGDSILGAIVAAELFNMYTDIDEGGLTRIKVALVSGESLAAVAADLGIADCIIFGDSELGTRRRGLHSALENVYEAITAALYLDGGLGQAKAWVDRTLMPRVDHSLATEPENPKSSLQEHLQAHKVAPVYRIVEEIGPPHARTFRAEVLAGSEVIGTGEGRSKKLAEAAAAAAALKELGIE